MFLRNYFNWCRFISSNHISAGFTAVDIGVYDLNGNNAPLFINSTSNYQSASSYSMSLELSGRIGVGDVQPSYEDYCLSSDVTSSVFLPTTAVSTSIGDGTLTRLVTFSGINNSQDTWNITEFGIAKTMYVGYHQQFLTAQCLLVKVMLDTPKVVQPHEAFHLDYQWVEP